VPRLRADRPIALWSWDITYLPTTVRWVWLYLYLVVDVWSRKVVCWDAGLIQSVSQARWPELPALGSPSGLAPSLCPKPALLRLISI